MRYKEEDKKNIEKMIKYLGEIRNLTSPLIREDTTCNDCKEVGTCYVLSNTTYWRCRKCNVKLIIYYIYRYYII